MTASLVLKLAGVALILLVAFRPRWWISRQLLARRGPRSDTPCMSRRELLQASAGYRKLALVICAITMLVLWIGEDAVTSGSGVGTAVFVAFFTGSILTATVLLAAAYTFVRGIFRSPRYVPPAWCLQCRPSTPVAEG